LLDPTLRKHEKLGRRQNTVGQAPFPWKLRSSSRQLDPKSIAPANTTMAASSRQKTLAAQPEWDNFVPAWTLRGNMTQSSLIQ